MQLQILLTAQQLQDLTREYVCYAREEKTKQTKKPPKNKTAKLQAKALRLRASRTQNIPPAL